MATLASTQRMHGRTLRKPPRPGRSLLAVLGVLLLATPVAGLSLLDATGDTAKPAEPIHNAEPAPATPSVAPLTPTEPVRFLPASSVGWSDLSDRLAGMTASGAAPDRNLVLECPPVDGSVVFGANSDTVIERSGCPFRIIDGADLLGAPGLAVDHNDPNRMAFFALHGCATDQGPNPWSRTAGGCAQSSSGQTHTTFTSTNEGRVWADQPHGTAGFGEQAHGVIDREGRVYVTHLFSNPIGADDDGERVFDYQIHLYKPQNFEDIQYYSKEIPNRAPGNTIEHVSMSLVTPWSRVETLEQYNTTLNGTEAPSEEQDVGNATIPAEQEDSSDDLVMVTWHERAYDHTTSPTGKSSWVGAAWTDTTSRNEWHVLPDEQLVGPCRHASNGEAWNGRVYVACAVDAGYTGRRGARIGDVDIWAIDPSGDDGRGTKHFISQATGIADGELKMDMNRHGMMALTSLKPSGDGPPYQAVNIDVNFAWYGRNWLSAGDAGALLHGAWGNQDFREARITAMELLDEDRPTLYMTYLERGMQETAPTVDPNDPTQSGQAVLEYKKSVSTWEPCGDGVMSLMDLQVGVVRSPFEEGVVNDFTGAFDDYQDGMVATVGVDGLERVYFVYGDHGVTKDMLTCSMVLPGARFGISFE